MADDLDEGELEESENDGFISTIDPKIAAGGDQLIPTIVRGVNVGPPVFTRQLADAELAEKMDEAAESGRYMVAVFWLAPQVNGTGGEVRLNMFRKMRDFPPGDCQIASNLFNEDMVKAASVAEG